MAPSAHGTEPPRFPGRFNVLTECGAETQRFPHVVNAYPAEGWQALWYALNSTQLAYTQWLPPVSPTYSLDISYQLEGDTSGCFQ
jgi:hypothetical protein